MDLSSKTYKEKYAKLCTELATASDDDKNTIETAIRKLEQEIAAKVASLLEEGEDLSRDRKYNEAYEKFSEALSYAVDNTVITSIEEKKSEALKLVKLKELNAEAIRLSNDNQFGAALDKFEEALEYVTNDFIYGLMENNVEVVHRLILKHYLKDGANGRSMKEQALMHFLKMVQDVTSHKIRFD